MNDVAQLAGPIITPTAAHLGSPTSMGSPSGGSTMGSPLSSAGLPPIYNWHAFIQGKDSRWLQLEVCREFQRNRCTRSDTDCRYAHPPPHVEITNGRVTACYDSIKGRCTRTNPQCKFFHPPSHLRDQLLNNGKNALAMKNMIISQLAYSGGQQGVAAMPAIMQNNKAAIHSVLPPALSFYDPATLAGAAPYLTGAMGTYGLLPGTPLVPLALATDPSGLGSINMMAPQAVVTGNHVLSNPQKTGRQDHRIDGYSGGIPGSLQSVSAAAAAAAAAAASSPYKRVATGDKTGVTMYQHPQSNAAAAAAAVAALQHHQQQQQSQHHHHHGGGGGGGHGSPTSQQQQQQHQHHQAAAAAAAQQQHASAVAASQQHHHQQQQHQHHQQAAAAAAAYQQAVALMSLQQPFVPVTFLRMLPPLVWTPVTGQAPGLQRF